MFKKLLSIVPEIVMIALVTVQSGLAFYLPNETPDWITLGFVITLVAIGFVASMRIGLIPPTRQNPQDRSQAQIPAGVRRAREGNRATCFARRDHRCHARCRWRDRPSARHSPLIIMVRRA